MSSSRSAAIVGGNRIPFARSNGRYARASNQDMLTAAIDGLVARFGLQDQRLGEVAAGAVLKHSRDFNLTRESVLGSRLSPSTPAYDVQQACGTGLETTILVANKIALGQIESGVAGGVDTTSDAPIAVNDDLREVLLELNRAKSVGARLKALGRLRPGQIVPSIPHPTGGLYVPMAIAAVVGLGGAWGLVYASQLAGRPILPENSETGFLAAWGHHH